MTCNNCGASLESTATTCPVCGTAVGAPSAGLSDTTGGDRPAWETGAPGSTARDAGTGGAEYGPGAGAPGPGAEGAWQGQPGYAAPTWQVPAAHPSGLPSDVRGWGAGAHASSFLAFIGLPVVGPLLVWLVKRDHPFVDHHGREALNFQLSVALYTIVGVLASVPIGLLTLGIGFIGIAVLGVALGIAWLVLPVVAAVKASNGEGYRYPMTIRFVR
ncbi:MAG: zinc ribbon domain-containing protein [Actinobacteria bacterium]|nr:zinc ribbon domain-containing protein [Actinomycetota bacterium]